MKQLERIKQKLKELKATDVNFEVFGSEEHRYSFNPVLTENEITSFEKKHNLTLAEEYRLFIKEIGNGGAGPFYGLLSLEDNEDQSVNLDFDFPFDAENPLSLDKYAEYNEKIAGAYEANNMDEEQALTDLKDSLIEEEYQNAIKGITFLCHEGCCMFNVLILKGKDKGTVWWFNFSDEVGVLPIIHKEKSVSFLDWYEIWLDDSLEFFKSDKKPFSTYGQFICQDNI